MSYSGHGQGSTDTFPTPPPVKAIGSYARASAKRPREDSDPESDFETEDNSRAVIGRVDFQHAMNTTATQALGEETQLPEYVATEVPPPLNPEHAALRADIEIITLAAMERLYSRITADIVKSAADTATAFKKTTNQLLSQIHSLGSQQLLTYQHPVKVLAIALATPAMVPAKKALKLKLTKKNAAADVAGGATAATPDTTPQVSLTALSALAPNTRGWKTVQTGTKKTKAPIPKPIPTIYPQAEREVTCHLQNGGSGGMTAIQPEKTYSERQVIADTALRKVNTALVNSKDVLAPPFI